MAVPELITLSYKDDLDRAAEASTIRERLLTSPTYDLRALADVNRDLQYILTRVIASDRIFDKELTEGFFAKGHIRRLLEESEDNILTSMLRHIAVVFQRALPDITPHLKSVNTLLKRQTGARSRSKANEVEPEIQHHLAAIGQLINVTYREYFLVSAQKLVTLAPEAPEVLAEARYLGSGKTSFWIFVEFLAMVEIYLGTVRGMSKMYSILAKERTQQSR